MIDINKLSDMLLIRKESLNKLTFANIIRKFKVDESKISKSRILSGLTDEYRNYCPLCLKKEPFYKLIWQVNEIDFCNTHNIQLYSSCWKCNKRVSLLPANGVIGYCPHCNADLSEAPLVHINKTPTEVRYIEDWNHLIYNCDELKLINNLTYEQTIALKLLFIIETRKISCVQNIGNIKQTLKNTKSNLTYIHLSTILEIVRESEISIKDLFNTTPDADFIINSFRENHPLYRQLSCLSPWCNGYNKPGTLERTSTSVHENKDGKKYKYYMYCKSCGIEYCIDDETNNLIERGYFISYGWNKVKHGLASDMSIKEMSRVFKISEDKIKRCIIFLVTNELVENNNLPLDIPKLHNKDIINKIMSLISHGVPSKQIRKLLKLKYNEFLYYWLYYPIYIEHIKYTSPSPYLKKDSNKYIENFDLAISYFLEHDIDITIKNISTHLNISHETLRYRGLLNKLKEYKQYQINIRKEKNRDTFKKNAYNYISKARKQGKIIRSEDVYKHLGVKRTVLVRSYPDVTRYIYNLIKKPV